ncbi:MAG: hypothetical protein P4L92_03435 [Rudaea sp.]|nr:hypothetical protein [Rudaea sp.]
MKRITAVARVRQAEAELAAAERELERSALPWRRRLQRHRGAVTIFGGFVGGLALTLLPSRWWARVGALVGASAAGIARSALTPALIGAVVSQIRHGGDTRPVVAAAPPVSDDPERV